MKENPEKRDWDTVRWMLTASGRKSGGVETMGTNDSPDVSRTTANPQDLRNKAVVAKLQIQPDAAQTHLLTFEHVDKDADVNLMQQLFRAEFKKRFTVKTS